MRHAQRAGLKTSPALIKHLFNGQGRVVSLQACVAFAAALDKTMSEVLETIVESSTLGEDDSKRRIIMPQHIVAALRSDPQIGELFRDLPIVDDMVESRVDDHSAIAEPYRDGPGPEELAALKQARARKRPPLTGSTNGSTAADDEEDDDEEQPEPEADEAEDDEQGEDTDD